jgi:hypothetical protein
MRLPLAANPRTAYGEDAEAAVRALFGLTAGVGGFAAVIAVAAGQLPLTGIPTLMLLGCLVAGVSIVVSAYAAAGVWVVLLPAAPGEAILVPLAMIALCLAVAVGPDRMLSWIARDAAPGSSEGAGAVAEGWIEEEPRRVG